MFEFVITKKKRSSSTINERFGFIDVPGANANNLKFSIADDIDIELMYYKLVAIEDFLHENENIITLFRGSVLSEKFIKPVDYVNQNNIENFKNLRGHFNIISIDKKNKSIRLVNDYFGLKPVYYGEDDSHYFISSSLHLLKRFDLKLDKSSLIEKIIFHHNILDNTFYSNVKTLKESTVLKLDNSFSCESYHDWVDYFTKASTKKRFSFDEYRTLFNNKVKNLANKDEPNLATLTGGHDGRAVISAFINGNLKIESFSFGRKGSENTNIPEDVAEKCGFIHSSIYLHEEFEKQYPSNCELVAKLADSELPFTQQPTIFAVKYFSQRFSRVFTGLLAGETVGPVHAKSDYINNEYFETIFGHKSINSLPEIFNLSNEEKHQIIKSITERINLRRNRLKPLQESSNSHLIYLADMITWGFRKFYAYQMHLMRYHLENIPIFYDFDLVNELVNSSYNNIYRNSYKSLFHRRNARLIQLNIINNNSKCLSNQAIDRGYSPREATSFIHFLPKIIKYFKRRKNISNGKNVPDFLSHEWTGLMKDYLINKEFNDDLINKIKENIGANIDYKLSEKDIISITNYIFLNKK